MTKKILIFSIIFTFFGLINFDKVFAITCQNHEDCPTCNYCDTTDNTCKIEDVMHSPRNNCSGDSTYNISCSDCINGECVTYNDYEQHHCSNNYVCNNNKQCQLTCSDDDECPACQSCVWSGTPYFSPRTCQIRDDDRNKCDAQLYHYCENGECNTTQMALPVCTNSAGINGFCSYNGGGFFGTYCGPTAHIESDYNGQCPPSGYGPDPAKCCIPNCSGDESCPPCYSCKAMTGGFTGYRCELKPLERNKCGDLCGFCDSNGTCTNPSSLVCYGTCGTNAYPGQCSTSDCEDYNYIENTIFNNTCESGSHCCSPKCTSNEDCPACYSCNTSSHLCEINNADNNKCDSSSCNHCIGGFCSGCIDGHICIEDLDSCVPSCSTKNGVCRNLCRANEIFSDPNVLDDCTNSGKICCIGGDNDTGTPCADQGGTCVDSGTCVGVPEIITECDEIAGKVCCTTPCVTDFKGKCETTTYIPEIGEYPIDAITECDSLNKKCYTKKCSGDVFTGWCPEGSTCNLGNCEIADSECKKTEGFVLVPRGTECPAGKIENESFTASLAESDADKICCVPFTETVIVETSMFFQGIGNECMNNGNCSVNDILNVVINITKFLTGIIGSIALLFFIISGVMMIFSGGSEEKVTKAKTMMTQTVIGLFIFLGAFMIVSFIQNSLDIGNQYKITSAPPQMVEVVVEEEEEEEQRPCETDPVHWRCNSAHPGWKCRTFTNTTVRDDLVDVDRCDDNNHCPDDSNTICCANDVTEGSIYSGNKTCPCTGNCTY
ncbi:MAG: pilin [Patescibacteria group bacterium]|nr:pilin [Patescibacteria group bacterium]MDD4303960.1 pilin [Patescibacteria group bacterium]MDD4695051.1 pilin [Patescibacteria group bacterium]